MGWAEQGWMPVAGGVTLPGAPITALPSVKVGTEPGEELAVFVAGYGTTGGIVYATGGTYDGLDAQPPVQPQWGPWAPVCNRQTLIGAPVGAAKLPTPVNDIKEQFALFIADPLGGIYATGGDPQEGWWCWESVSEGQTLPGAPVTAVNWGNQAAVFVADPNGDIYANAGIPGGGWGNWGIVCDRRTLPGAPVTALPLPTAVQRPGEELALFMADSNGGVYATSGTPARWRCWGSVPGVVAVPGSKVTAVRWTDQQFALFVVSPDGGTVYTTAGTPWGGWGGWVPLPQANTTATSGIAAINLPGGFTNELALFTTFFDGTVQWIRGTPQPGGFLAWEEIPGASFPFWNRGPVTAVVYGGDPPNRVALFVTDPQGAIYSTWGKPAWPT